MNDLFFGDRFFQKSNYIRIPLAGEPARPSDEDDHKKTVSRKKLPYKKAVAIATASFIYNPL